MPVASPSPSSNQRVSLGESETLDVGVVGAALKTGSSALERVHDDQQQAADDRHVLEAGGELLLGGRAV